MYSDPFFIHTNKMLKLLQYHGHLISRTKTQSTALSRDDISVVMQIQAPKVNLVVKQFINSVDMAVVDTQIKKMKEQSGYVDYIPDAEGGPVLVYNYVEGEES